MASRRKASTPCMIRPEHTLVEPEDDDEEPQNMQTNMDTSAEEAPMETDLPREEQPSVPSEPDVKPLEAPAPPDKSEPDSSRPQRRQQGGYECKYCSFSTQNLNTFKEHVDANHPNVILNPLYLCAVCNFNTKKFDTLTEHNERCHPGESNFKFKRIKLNNQTILEQTIEGCSNNAVIYNSANGASTKGEDSGVFPLGKSSAVKIGKPKMTPLDNNKRTESQLGKLTPELTKKPITALNVNGTVIIPESTLLKADSLSHIMPSLQRPPNYTQVPKIAVPLNTTKYNPSLDSNLTLISSFNKFPYPTQAELSWLTAASKHPEEQIKVWFTTQRLKQGISWSPEEVEEARKKMFNGTIQSVPQTFTVVASQLSTQSSTSPTIFSKASHSAASLLQSLPCQLLGQTSLVLTPVANGSTATCAPLALTVGNQVAQSLKRPLPSPIVATETKRPSIIQTIQAPIVSKMASPKLLSFTVDANKTAEQLSVLRASYTQCPFPEEDEIYRLIETTGLSRGEIKKWFSEQRLLNLKGAPPPPLLVKAEVSAVPKDGPVKKPVPSHFPLLERVKGKTSEQLKALEESFQRSSSPSDAKIDQLAQETRLSKTEVDCWFVERRALRDDMEKTLLTMAPKSAEERSDRGAAGASAGASALHNGASYGEQDGKAQRSSPHPPLLTSSLLPSPLPPPLSSSSSPPVLSAPSPHPPILSASVSPPVLSSSSSSSSSPSPHPPVLSASISPDAIDSRSLALLREVFCRTQGPTPEEYSQLESQTGLGRTDIVRWFKENRSALKTSGPLDWMEGFRKQNPRQQNGSRDESPEKNGQTSTSGNAEKKQNTPQELKTVKASIGVGEEPAENSKLLNRDLVQWFTNKLGQSVADLSRTRPEQTSPNAADKGRWVKVTMAMGEEKDGGGERQKLAPDTDVLALEHPGRVTG